jgi:hypothetical protein
VPKAGAKSAKAAKFAAITDTNLPTGGQGNNFSFVILSGERCRAEAQVITAGVDTIAAAAEGGLRSAEL